MNTFLHCHGNERSVLGRPFSWRRFGPSRVLCMREAVYCAWLHVVTSKMMMLVHVQYKFTGILQYNIRNVMVVLVTEQKSCTQQHSHKSVDARSHTHTQAQSRINTRVPPLNHIESKTKKKKKRLLESWQRRSFLHTQHFRHASDSCVCINLVNALSLLIDMASSRYSFRARG